MRSRQTTLGPGALLGSRNPRSLPSQASGPSGRAITTALLTLVLGAGACAEASDTTMAASSSSAQSTGASTGGAGGAGGASACTPAATEECYSGPAGTQGVGVCTAGTRTCAEDGASFGACEGEVKPTKDDCATPEDEDCDGASAACSGEATWARSAGDVADQRVNAVAVDASGNIAVTGAFAGSINLGEMVASAGAFDIFVAKLDPKGNVLWLQTFGDLQDQSGNGVAFDAAGNVIVTGDFKGVVNFGGEPIGSAGAEDMFVVKLDANGKHVWSKGFGDAAFQSGKSVAADATGNIVVLSTLEGTTSFGGPMLTSAGGTDVALTKLNPGGNHLTSKIFGGALADTAGELALDATGGIVLTGSFAGTVSFGGSPILSAGGTDVFAVRFTNAGIHLWSKGFGDATDQSGRSVDVDASGNVILTGAFLGTVGFGGDTLKSAGSEDIFVAKLNSMGEHVWSKNFGDASQQVGRAVSVDASGNVILAGSLNGSADFGGGPLTSAGLSDVFLAKLNPEGAHVLSVIAGSADDQFARAAAIDATGHILLGGQFKDTLDLGTVTLTSKGSYDLFLAKIAP